ncbi:putative F-box protein At3g16210 [Vicia villosa]|uniref:putative F-box protein At3g16210 n=1 Tax=Vicia villosa TaxID=3911 RepID=UPI00273CB9FC|nr:putative F-box protein At3g16210 [Vicia villosa]
MTKSYIPDDAAFSILSKLPLKSLHRFSCLQKSWSLDSSFMIKLKNNVIYNNPGDSFLPLYLSENELYYFRGERFEKKTKLDFPTSFNIQEFDIFGFSSVKGIFCLIESLYTQPQRVVLWNPTTEEFKIIPPSLRVSRLIESSPHDDEWPEFYVHGFGYDQVNNDYKVVRCVQIPLTHYLHIFWEIYSLRNNCWSELKFKMPASYSDRQDLYVYTDGTCHWLSVRYKGYKDRLCLISFYLNNEVFKKTYIPYMDETFDREGEGIQMIVLQKFIGLISYHKSTTTLHISILGEIGVKKSWTKLIVIGMTPSLMHPIRAKKNEEITNNKLTWFDHLITHIFEKLEGKQHNSLVYYEKNYSPTAGMDLIVRRPPIINVYVRRKRKVDLISPKLYTSNCKRMRLI